MGFLNDYLVLVVVGICLCVGYILKNLVPGNGINRYIPLIVGVLGVVINLWLCAWSVTPQTVLAGLVSGLSSTGMYEALRNFIGKKSE